jgi:hypothetical protein
MTHTYTLEQWIEYHGGKISPANYDEEYAKWLKWRLSVDRGETRLKGMIIVRPEFGYVSPTTGNVITSDKARREDLASSGCIEYDPEMKTDQRRRIEAQDAELDKSFDETIDKAIETMPSDKRVKLENEMASGLDVEILRTTV